MEFLVAGTYKCHLICCKSLCRCHQIKDLEKRKLSWIFWTGPKCNHCILRRERQKEIVHTNTERGCEDAPEKDVKMLVQSCSNAATNQGMLAAKRSWKKQETHSLLEPPEGPFLCQYLDFGSMILILDFWLTGNIINLF